MVRPAIQFLHLLIGRKTACNSRTYASLLHPSCITFAALLQRATEVRGGKGLAPLFMIHAAHRATTGRLDDKGGQVFRPSMAVSSHLAGPISILTPRTFNFLYTTCLTLLLAPRPKPRANGERSLSKSISRIFDPLKPFQKVRHVVYNSGERRGLNKRVRHAVYNSGNGHGARI